jgi:hypothetical protein
MSSNEPRTLTEPSLGTRCGPSSCVYSEALRARGTRFPSNHGSEAVAETIVTSDELRTQTDLNANHLGRYYESMSGGSGSGSSGSTTRPQCLVLHRGLQDA